jgi:Zn-dependent protease
MHDPFAWSFPMGRLFGITIRIHWLFPFITLGVILWSAFGSPLSREVVIQPPYLWVDACVLALLLFVSVLFHEFAHCFSARAVGGDASEVLIWPLGGLANVDLPHRPRAHFLCAAAGPASNLLLCLVSLVLLLFIAGEPLMPPWNPFPTGWPYREMDGLVRLYPYQGETAVPADPLLSPAVWVARLFWVNWILALFNLILVGFPMDAGRMLQALLWPYFGYRSATLVAVYSGFVVSAAVGLYAITFGAVLAFALALFIMNACRQQWIMLEAGGEEGAFGYDFSQGYTSLERGVVDAPARPRVSWWYRWLQRRAARRLLREQEQREAEERRLDDLLEKVHREGRQALTDEEVLFMKRVSDRYRRQ